MSTPNHQSVEGYPAIKPLYNWYLVYTKPREEIRARNNLKTQGFTVFLPNVTRDIMRHKKLITQLEPLFPRYLFIALSSNLEGQSWAPIRSTKGVSKLVAFGDTPTKVPEELIQTLMYYDKGAEKQNIGFSEGERIRIVEGPFAGLEGVFQIKESEKRAMVLIDILHQHTKVRISPEALRKIL